MHSLYVIRQCSHQMLEPSDNLGDGLRGWRKTCGGVVVERLRAPSQHFGRISGIAFVVNLGRVHVDGVGAELGTGKSKRSVEGLAPGYLYRALWLLNNAKGKGASFFMRRIASEINSIKYLGPRILSDSF